jgi:hypothetical protein
MGEKKRYLTKTQVVREQGFSMTLAEYSEQKPKDIKEQLQDILDGFGTLLEGYEEANPDFEAKTLMGVVYMALRNLRALVEDPKETEITWDYPLAELQYPVNVDWDKLQVVLLHIDKEDLQKPIELTETVAKSFVDAKNLYVFRKLTKEVAYLQTETGYTLLLPQDLTEKLNKHRPRKRARLLKQLREPYTHTTTVELPKELSPGRKKPGKLSVLFQINPLIFNAIEKRGYYSIIVGIKLRGVGSRYWSPETQKQFWDGFLNAFKGGLPEEKLPELPKPKTSPVKPSEALVKASLHTELQKFGHRQRAYQESLFDLLDEDGKKRYTDSGIEVAGVDITIAQNKALHAIQTLLSKTDYKGNLPAKHLRKQDNTFGYEGSIPVLRFASAEYLDAFGVGKRPTERGFVEYNANERAEALRALWELGTKSFFMVYRRTYWEGKEERVDAVRTVRPLFNIKEGYEALSRAESDSLSATPTPEAQEKLKYIGIEPAPILVDQINSYFLLKPANYQQEIKLLVPHASKYIYRFIDWLIAQAELKRRNEEALVIRIGEEPLAEALRMDAWLKNRQWKQIAGSLKKCYETAKNLGYLLEYRRIQGKTKELEELVLNPQKYSGIKTQGKQEASSTQSYS